MANWTCDTCGEKIEKPEDGWVEWVTLMNGESPSGRGLRLVHSHPASPRENKCQYNAREEHEKDGGILGDLALKSFLGPDGLMKLLVFISEDDLPIGEVLEMIKRLNIPGYEEARNYFSRAINDGVFEPNMPKDFYVQTDIQATLEYIERTK